MNSLIAERENNLLGALMSPYVKITSDMEQLQPEWFAGHKAHGMIYRSWLDLRKSDETTDPIAVFERINRTFVLTPEEKGELFPYLIEMAKEASTIPKSLRVDIKRITDNGKKLALRRSLIDAMTALDEAEDYDKGLADALHCIDSKATEGMQHGLMTAEDIARIGLEFVAKRVDDGFTGLTTGFDELDDMLFGGLRGGEIYTVFGPPKEGKTTAATTFAENIALSMVSGESPVVLIFSREMKEVQLAVRHFASLGGADQKNMLTGKMRQEDYDGIAVAVGKISNTRIVYDLESDTPSQIALKCAQVKRAYGRLDLAMVDHIGLCRSDDKKQTRQQEVTEITWSLKKLAGRMNLPIIMVAQSNRKYSERADRTPQLSDLGESASIEKDSDAIIGIRSYKEGEMKGFVEIYVVAARIGESGMTVGTFKNGRIVPAYMQDYLSAKQFSESKPKDSKWGDGI